MDFLDFSGPCKKWAGRALNGAGNVFSGIKNIADTLGRTDFDFENFYFLDFFGSQISGLGPLGPSLGPPTWAPRGPTHLGPTWAHPLGPHVHPLGPHVGPPTWAPRVGRGAQGEMEMVIFTNCPQQPISAAYSWGHKFIEQKLHITHFSK